MEKYSLQGRVWIHVGSHMVDRLLSDGHEVIVIDNCFYGEE